jgi:hypothetical protein
LDVGIGPQLNILHSQNGAVESEAKIEHYEFEVTLRKLHTWRRRVEINENDTIVLARDPAYASWRGEFEVEYGWTSDAGRQPAGPIWIILIRRAVIVKQPRLCLTRCLVIRVMNDKDYDRVGQDQMRYGSEDNP